MDSEELEKYKEALLALESRLERELKEIPERLDFGDQVDQEEDEADESVAADEQVGIRDEMRARLENVRRALNKIKEGTYGLCEKCGQPIEKEILDIVPESSLCKVHKLEV
ncbi:MAG: RNA polymerase-binding protein DksA [Parcubacteria group bacterium]